MICGGICRLSDNDETIPNDFEIQFLLCKPYNK